MQLRAIPIFKYEHAAASMLQAVLHPLINSQLCHANLFLQQHRLQVKQTQMAKAN